MPTILIWRGHRFFYSADGGEPPHVHAEGIWLHDAGVAYSFGYSVVDLSALVRHVKARRRELQEAWDDYFGD